MDGKVKEAGETQLNNVMKAEVHLRESRDFSKAQDLYSEWIEKFVRNNEIVASEEQWRKCVALAYNNRGQLKYMRVDFNEAVQDYNKALEYDPNFPACYYNRGTILYRMGCFDNAILDMRKAVDLSPETVEFRIGFEQCQKELTNRRDS